MAQKEGGTAMMCSPLPLHNTLGQSRGAPEMLDSPASRDKVDNGNNQSDH